VLSRMRPSRSLSIYISQSPCYAYAMTRRSALMAVKSSRRPWMSPSTRCFICAAILSHSSDRYCSTVRVSSTAIASGSSDAVVGSSSMGTASISACVVASASVLGFDAGAFGKPGGLGAALPARGGREVFTAVPGAASLSVAICAATDQNVGAEPSSGRVRTELTDVDAAYPHHWVVSASGSTNALSFSCRAPVAGG
jgi:hypothetical protein